LKAGFIAGVTAFANAAIGASFGNPGFGSPEYFANIGAHALVGCASSVASGGSCKSGALAAGVSTAAGPVLNGHGLAVDLTANSVVGGLASVAGGGKFANGAVTGAFGYLLSPGGLADAKAASSGLDPRIAGAYACGPPCAVAAGGAGISDALFGTTLLATMFGWLGTQAVTSSAQDQYTTIYRAVGPQELYTLEATGTYGSNPSQNGKYFALTLNGVYQFANSPFNQDMTVTATSVPNRVLNSGYFFNDPGGAGSSVYFQQSQLPTLYSTMTRPQILPPRYP
jgi:hypothetical protein